MGERRDRPDWMVIAGVAALVAMGTGVLLISLWERGQYLERDHEIRIMEATK